MEALVDRAGKEYEQSFAIRPDSLYHADFGIVLLQAGRLSEAADQFARALEVNDGWPDVWHNLGAVRLEQGRLEKAAGAFRRAHQINPTEAETQAMLGRVLWQLGRREAAVKEWEGALRQDPRNATALAGLGLAQLRHAPERAAQQLTAALRINPGLAWAQSACGVALGRLNLRWEALDRHANAVQLEAARCQLTAGASAAELAINRRRLAHALRETGNPEEAAKEYAEALRLDPGWPPAATAAAWHLATNPRADERDPAAACELAAQVREALATPPVEALDALAAALAAAGRYADAAAVAREALAKAPPDRAAIEARLKLYEEGKPFVADR
jgi:tetratricopeptide (TPR) repeat protein